MKENPIKFCAVNDSDVLLFNNEKIPQVVAIDKITTTFNLKPGPTITLKSGLTFQEYLLEIPLFIHSVNKTTGKISLNRIRSIIHYKNLNNMYKIKPYLLSSFSISQKNSLLDQELNPIDLQIHNINNNNLIKYNKYYGKKIGIVNGIDLSLELGFIVGQLKQYGCH